MGFVTYVYSRIHWLNKSESLSTPIGKSNLNHMDSAIYHIAKNLNIAYNEVSAGKLDRADADKVIVGMPTWNPNTGVLAFKFYDGTTFQVDFNVEKIPVSFSMDSAGVITMRTSDGTEWTADIGDMIPDDVFEDSDRIVFSKTKNAYGGYKIRADLRRGSITGEYLQPDYLADVTVQAGKAAASAKQASDFADNARFDAKLSQSYAVGGSGVREGEDGDCAKKYKEKCQEIFDNLNQDEKNQVIFKLFSCMAQTLEMNNGQKNSDRVITVLQNEVYRFTPVGTMAVFFENELVALGIGYVESRPLLDTVINKLPNEITIEGPVASNDYKTTVSNSSDKNVRILMLYTYA